MSSSEGTLQQLCRHLTLALGALRAATSDPEQFKNFLYRLGWEATVMPPEYASLGVSAGGAQAKLDLQPPGAPSSQILDLMSAVKATFDAIQGISVAPPGVDASLYLSRIQSQITDGLITNYLALGLPAVYNLFASVNVIQISPSPSTPTRPTFMNVSFQWPEISKVISDPTGVPSRTFGWGTPSFRAEDALDCLGELFMALDFPVQFIVPDSELVSAYGDMTAIQAGVPPSSLKIPFYYVEIGGKQLEASFVIHSLPVAPGTVPGIVIEPHLPPEFPLKLKLADTIGGRILAGTNSAETFGIVIAPDKIAIIYPPQPATPPPSAAIGFGFDFTPATPTILAGSPGATRLEFSAASVDFNVSPVVGELDAVLVAQLNNLALVISAGEGDSFLQNILGVDEARVEISLGIEASWRHGVHFLGSGAFEVSVNPHIHIGPIAIDEVTISFAVPNTHPPDLRLDLGAGISGTLGPLAFTLKGVGLRMDTTFARGNFGPFDLGIGFKPPDGVGLSLDVGVIKGGGFLYVDAPHDEYAGALELVFADFLSLHAIGLITTKMPDGTSGFSLLIIITADFGAGIQLGFGFTLLAVGGLLGLNRAMSFQPLMDGIRTDSIESIMFPQDVVANATRIISDLRAIFPPQEGTFLIGPMAKIGWGEPTLISLSLGIIIEIPPGDIAILGILKLALPAEDIAVLVLQVNFAGALEFDKKRFYFFASLFDSHILFITLEGEIGVLMAFGDDDANFVVTVGGFHPQYNPPPLPFPSPKRIEIDIINESFARIRCDGYFAVTSNSVQFGAHADMFFGFSACNIQGHAGLDALFQFSPFHFSVSMSVSFSVNVFDFGMYGIGISLTLEGTTPWHASGTASLSFLLFSVDIGIDFTWGDSRDTMLPPVAVMPILSGELSKQSNWKAVLPTGSNLLVTIRQLDPAESAMVLHPVGTLQVSQRAVPLDVTLDKDGNQQPSDANFFSLDVTGGALVKTRTLPEQFAPAQFQNMDDAKKLSQPAYVPMDGGIELSAAGNLYASGTAITRNVRYDLTIIDTKLRRVFQRFFVYTGSLFAHFLMGSSVTCSTLSAYSKAQAQPYDQHVSVNSESFAVTLQSNNKVYAADSGAFSSQTAAHDYLSRAVSKDPTLTGTLQVLPQFEVAA